MKSAYAVDHIEVLEVNLRVKAMTLTGSLLVVVPRRSGT